MQNEKTTLPLRDRRPAPGGHFNNPAAPFQSQGDFDPNHAARGRPRRLGQPFRDAEACIFWTIKALAGAEEPPAAGSPQASQARRRMTAAICTPAEVVKCLDKLYRQRRIDLHHVRVLRIWGHRGRAPKPDLAQERGDWRVWREALERLDWPLRSIGIIS